MIKEIEGQTGHTVAGTFLFYGHYDHHIDFSNNDLFCTGVHTIKEGKHQVLYDHPKYYIKYMTREDFINAYPSEEKAMAVLKVYGK